MPIRFEEKEFECAFNRQLGIIGHNSWCPGQFLEATVGFDGAALIDDPFILNLYRPWHRLRQQGVILDPSFLRGIIDVADHVLPPQSFRFNFFAQHKRPEYRDKEGRLKKEWPSWNKPYFRYKIQDDQQAILAKLEKHFGQSALVLYSCPAFYTKSDLWAHMQNGTIVQNTNFAEPSKLTGHHSYTFDAPGAHGFAFSEKEEIQGRGIEELIAERKESSHPKPISKLIISAGEAIKQAFEEMGNVEDPHKPIWLARNIVNKLSEKREMIGDRTATALTDALAHIMALHFVFGTSLILIGTRE